MRCNQCRKYPCNKTQIVEDHLRDIERIVNMEIILGGCNEFNQRITIRGDEL